MPAPNENQIIRINDPFIIIAYHGHACAVITNEGGGGEGGESSSLALFHLPSFPLRICHSVSSPHNTTAWLK